MLYSMIVPLFSPNEEKKLIKEEEDEEGKRRFLTLCGLALHLPVDNNVGV